MDTLKEDDAYNPHKQSNPQAHEWSGGSLKLDQ